MKPDTFFGGLQVLWKARQLRKLVDTVHVPTEQDLGRALELLRDTQTRSYLWPELWPISWFRALAQNESVWGQTACMNGKTHDYPQDFIFEMVEYALLKNKLELLEYFQASLIAQALPPIIWERLEGAYPLLQIRFLTALPGLETVEGPHQEFVTNFLLKSDPFLWMYEHASWYDKLAAKWQLRPPSAWWTQLYTHNLYHPPSPFQYLVQNHQGLRVTRLVETMGKKTYSYAQLEHNRYRMLHRDPWYLVKSTFFGDHIGWFIQRENDSSHDVRVTAFAVTQAYFMKTIEADVLARIPEDVRDATADPAIQFIVGAPTPQEAYAMFCEWLDMNNGALSRSTPDEAFPINDLL